MGSVALKSVLQCAPIPRNLVAEAPVMVCVSASIQPLVFFSNFNRNVAARTR